MPADYLSGKLMALTYINPNQATAKIELGHQGLNTDSIPPRLGQAEKRELSAYMAV
jgi:hypothetical protein